MNLKHKLFLTSLSALILIGICLTIKQPVLIDFRHGDFLGSKSGKLTLPSPSPSLIIVNQTKQKTTTFSKEGIPVLMYHSISTIPGNSLGVPVKQFSEEMEWLHDQNYHSISSEYLYQALVNKAPVPEKPIFITFDDGYADNYRSAWPIVKQNGFRATFFIITNSVGPGMMNWDQLNELVKQGNSIGSHTVHHLDLATLTYKQQESELAVSKRELENHLGIKIQDLCFPSGKYNKSTLKLMQKLRYRLGFTTKPGRVHLGDNLLTLTRERIYGGMPLSAFQNIIRH